MEELLSEDHEEDEEVDKEDVSVKKKKNFARLNALWAAFREDRSKGV